MDAWHCCRCLDWHRVEDAVYFAVETNNKGSVANLQIAQIRVHWQLNALMQESIAIEDALELNHLIRWGNIDLLNLAAMLQENVEAFAVCVAHYNNECLFIFGLLE